LHAAANGCQRQRIPRRPDNADTPVFPFAGGMIAGRTKRLPPFSAATAPGRSIVGGSPISVGKRQGFRHLDQTGIETWPSRTRPERHGRRTALPRGVLTEAWRRTRAAPAAMRCSGRLLFASGAQSNLRRNGGHRSANHPRGPTRVHHMVGRGPPTACQAPATGPARRAAAVRTARPAAHRARRSNSGSRHNGRRRLLRTTTRPAARLSRWTFFALRPYG